MENLKPRRVVELLDRSHEADVALLDEVQERQAAAAVLLGDGDDQAEVGRGQRLAALPPVAHHDAAAVARLQVLLGHLGVPAPGIHDLGFLAPQDVAAERLLGDAVGPVEEGTQALVVAALLVAVVDGHVAEVDHRGELLGIGCLVVLGHDLLGVLQHGLGMLFLGGALCAGELEIR